MSMDFFKAVREATTGIARAQGSVERAEAALAAAKDTETRAWAVLYAIPGVSADTAVQVTGETLAKCRSEADLVKRAASGRG